MTTSSGSSCCCSAPLYRRPWARGCARLNPTFLGDRRRLSRFVPNGPHWTLDPTLALALSSHPVLLDAAYDTSLRDVPKLAAVRRALVIIAARMAAGAPWWWRAVSCRTCRGPLQLRSAPSSRRPMRRRRLQSCQARVAWLTKILEGEACSTMRRAVDLPCRRVITGCGRGLTFGEIIGTSSFPCRQASLSVSARSDFAARARIDREAPMAIIRSSARRSACWTPPTKSAFREPHPCRLCVTIARHRSARQRDCAFPLTPCGRPPVFVLDVLAFVMIGMQVGPISTGSIRGKLHYGLRSPCCDRHHRPHRLGDDLQCGAAREFAPRRRSARPMLRPSVGSGLVLSSTACAASSRSPRPSHCRRASPIRDLCRSRFLRVVLGTLDHQGLTPRPADRAAEIDEYDPVAHEVAQGARRGGTALRSRTLDGHPSDDAKLLRKELSRVLAQAEEEPGRHVIRGPAPVRSDCAASRRAAARHTSCGERDRRGRYTRVGGKSRPAEIRTTGPGRWNVWAKLPRATPRLSCAKGTISR